MYIDVNGLVVNDGSLVHNGQAFGVGQEMADIRFEPGLRRPFLDERGEHCVVVNNWKKQRYDEKRKGYFPERMKLRIADLRARGINHPTWNAQALTKQAWQLLDDAIVREPRKRLRAWADAMAAVGRTIPGMSKMTMEYQAMSDPGSAQKDMDGLSEGPSDRPLFQLRSIPLPITHCDFFFSERELAVSRSTGAPLDTTGAEWAARRVAETIEQTIIGTLTGVTYGTVSAGPGAHQSASLEYGYTNFTYRTTKTDLTTPLGTNPEATVRDVLEMRQTMRDNNFFGPYIVYHSTGYDQWLDDDYFRTGGTSATRTLRERVESIEDVAALRRLDYLTSGYQLIMVQLTREVLEAIDGMDIQAMMWEEKGGLLIRFKVMAIHVPLFKAPYSALTTGAGAAGVLHATTS